MKKWTESLTESLRVLWAKGISATRIARVLQTTPNAVTSKARRLSLEPRESPIMTQLDRYAEALSECDNVVQAGAMIGVKETRSRELFRQLCRDLGEQAV